MRWLGLLQICLMLPLLLHVFVALSVSTGRLSHNLSRWHVNPFVEFYVSVVLAIRLYGCLWNRGTLLAWCMPVRLWCEGQAPVCVISHLQLHHNADFQDVKPYVPFCCRLVRVSLQFLDSIWRQCSTTVKQTWFLLGGKVVVLKAKLRSWRDKDHKNVVLDSDLWSSLVFFWSCMDSRFIWSQSLFCCLCWLAYMIRSVQLCL